MTDDRNGRRWYDSTRVILALFGIVATLVTLIGTVTWSTIQTSRDRIETLERKGERTDEKLDRIGSDVRDIKDELRRKP